MHTEGAEHSSGDGSGHSAAGSPAAQRPDGTAGARVRRAALRTAVREVFAVVLLVVLAATALRERWSAPTDGAHAATSRIERRLAAMGTHLSVVACAADRATALAASEAAVSAVLAAERRLSNWSADSELVRLLPLGAALPSLDRIELPSGASDELAADLAALAPLVAACEGAFDPRASAGRGGPFGAVDSGGFGKGRALDLAVAAGLARGATHIEVDLGGQVLVGGDDRERSVSLADPRDRSRAVVEVATRHASLATSCQSERPGHIVDPSSTASVPFDGALTVFADEALAADVFSTALFVLGRERALALAARLGVDVLVLEPRGARLLVHSSAGLEGRVRALAADVDVVRPSAPPPFTCPSPTSPTGLHGAAPVD
jgi:thiamine biosynthesis lipoprotein